MPRTKKYLVKTASNSSPSFYKNIGKRKTSSAASYRTSSTLQNVVPMPAKRKRGRPRKVVSIDPHDAWEQPSGTFDTDDIVANLKHELAQQMEQQMKQVMKDASKRLDALVTEVAKHQRPATKVPARYETADDHEENPYYDDDEAFRDHSYSSNLGGSGHSPRLPQQRSSYPSLPPQEPAIQSFANTQLMEKLAFLEKELMAAHEREKQLKSEMNSVEQQFNQEKERLANEMKAIKEGITPTTTPENSRFFSLSNELDQIVQAMNQLVTDPKAGNTSGAPTVTTSTTSTPTSSSGTTSTASPTTATPANTPPATAPATSTSEADKTTVEKKETGKKPESPLDAKAANSKKMKKLGIAGLAFVLIIGGIAVAAMQFMGGAAAVDPELVQNYLPEGAAVPTSEPQSDASTAPPEEGEVQGASTQAASSPSPPSNPTQKYAESQSDISYAETRWETHKDPTFGVQLDYPVNASNLVKTDTSITVIRMTGYIFKIQKVASAQELADYWDQIKARSLRYKVKETTFREQPALFLELEDITDYPGDRYLVKVGDFIYDIWYATPSTKLSDDDEKRVDIMMNSLQFIELPPGS